MSSTKKIVLSIVDDDKHVKLTIENPALVDVILKAVGPVVDLDKADDASHHTIGKDGKSALVAA